MDKFKDNLEAHLIMKQAIRRSNRPLNKYSEGIHQITEEIVGESGDRGAYDCGMERELITEHNQ